MRDLPEGLRRTHTQPTYEVYEYESRANWVQFMLYTDGTVRVDKDDDYDSMIPVDVLRWIADRADRRR